MAFFQARWAGEGRSELAHYLVGSPEPYPASSGGRGGPLPPLLPVWVSLPCLGATTLSANYPGQAWRDVEISAGDVVSSYSALCPGGGVVYVGPCDKSLCATTASRGSSYGITTVAGLESSPVLSPWPGVVPSLPLYPPLLPRGPTCSLFGVVTLPPRCGSLRCGLAYAYALKSEGVFRERDIFASPMLAVDRECVLPPRRVGLLYGLRVPASVAVDGACLHGGGWCWLPRQSMVHASRGVNGVCLRGSRWCMPPWQSMVPASLTVDGARLNCSQGCPPAHGSRWCMPPWQSMVPASTAVDGARLHGSRWCTPPWQSMVPASVAVDGTCLHGSRWCLPLWRWMVHASVAVDGAWPMAVDGARLRGSRWCLPPWQSMVHASTAVDGACLRGGGWCTPQWQSMVPDSTAVDGAGFHGSRC